MTEHEAVVEVLAIARITRLITTDRVPFGVPRAAVIAWAWKRRARSDIRTGEVNQKDPYAAELLSCPWCMSMWVALAVLLVLRHLPGWRFLARVLAASYVAGFLAER